MCAVMTFICLKDGEPLANGRGPYMARRRTRLGYRGLRTPALASLARSGRNDTSVNNRHPPYHPEMRLQSA